MSKRKSPSLRGDFEFEVLRAVLDVPGESYAVPIVEALSKSRGKRVALGSVHTTLRRLEEKGFVKSNKGSATAERGGKAKRLYSVTASGHRAMNDRFKEAKRIYQFPGLPAGGVS